MKIRHLESIGFSVTLCLASNKIIAVFLMFRSLLLFFGLVAVLAWAGLTLSRSRDFQIFGDIVSHVETEKKVVALTFDDGPAEAQTDEIIALLEGLSVHATFFLIGSEIEKSPQSAAALVDAGHEIGNHSFSHKRMVLKSPAWMRDELARTDRLIRDAGHEGQIYFRPPYGKKLFMLPYVLDEQERASVMWSVEPETDFDASLGAVELAKLTLAQVKAGDIILLHPMYSSRQVTRDALPLIIQGLRVAGFEIVTLGELMELR